MWIKLVFVVILAIIVRHVVVLALLMHAFKGKIFNHKPGPCRIIPGIVNGSEDIFVLPNGLAFISSGIGIQHLFPDIDPRINDFQGRIHLFDFNKPNEGAKILPMEGNFDINTLRTHGIDVWHNNETGQIRLFAVNHYNIEMDTIEVFDFDQSRAVLKHRKTIQDKLIISVNDVLATGPDSFYLTNDGYYRGRMRVLESLLFRPLANVVFYDGKEAKVVMENGLGYNGINVSPNGKIVYINEVFAGGKMHIMERSSDNSLTLIETLTFGSMCDNVFVDKDGDIWQGCHPVGYQFSLHSQNITIPAPSQVLHVEFLDESRRKYEIREVLSDDGKLISGSSVAAYYNGAMLVGTVLDKLHYCQVLEY